MAASNVCRLCRVSCCDSIRLYDAHGETNEIYAITIKYFQPMFLEVEPGALNQLAVLCAECWHHISGFNNFQQTVLLLHINLNKAAPCGTETFSPVNSHLMPIVKCEPETISIPDEDEFQDIVNTTEFESSHSDDIQFIVRDCENLDETNLNAIALESHPQIIPENPNSEEAAFCPQQTTDVDEVAHGDMDSEESWDIGSISKSHEPEAPTSTEAAKNEEIPTDTFKISDHIYRPVRINKCISQKVDEVIARWMPNIPCRLCSITSKTFNELRQHFQTNHPDDEFYSECCGRKFKFRYRMEEHALVHLDPNAFKCTRCHKLLTSRAKFWQHCLQYHKKS